MEKNRQRPSFPRSSPGQAPRKRESGPSGSVFDTPGPGIPVIATGGIFRNLVLALTIVATGGCGYQLRGGVSLPPALDGIHVAGPAGIGGALTQMLESGGADIRPGSESAKAVLRLSRERFTRRVLSVDPDTGKEREIELAYSVAFRVAGGDGEELMPEQTVSLLRDYVIDVDAVLGKSREQGVLHAEMRRDAAAQIMRRVAAALGR